MSSTLGRRIRRAREREGLTLAALADKVGVTAAAIYNWELGTQPRGVNKEKLEEVLGKLSKGISKGSGPQDEQAQDTHNSEVSSFGIWLRDQRTKAAMSVPELARSAKISAVALYNIESGKIQNLKLLHGTSWQQRSNKQSHQMW